MRDAATIIEELRTGGHRITRIRKEIIVILYGSTTPLTAQDVGGRLADKEVSANKTTIYREIDFLKGQGIIREIDVGDVRKHYEMQPDNHHHHLVCLRCRSVLCVAMEACLHEEIHKIAGERAFTIVDHSLKLFGICASCR